MTKEDIKHIANLAKIKLEDEEIEEYYIEFNELISEMDEVLKMDIEDSDKNELEGILRDDKILNSTNIDKILNNSKETENGYIKVSSKKGAQN